MHMSDKVWISTAHYLKFLLPSIAVKSENDGGWVASRGLHIFASLPQIFFEDLNTFAHTSGIKIRTSYTRKSVRKDNKIVQQPSGCIFRMKTASSSTIKFSAQNYVVHLLTTLQSCAVSFFSGKSMWINMRLQQTFNTQCSMRMLERFYCTINWYNVAFLAKSESLLSVLLNQIGGEKWGEAWLFVAK